MTDETPVIGPVTVTFTPESAAETAMVLQHILYNVPESPRPDQAARAHFLGEAAVALSNAMLKAMHDAGLSDELIARASGHLYRAPQEESAQMELQPENMTGKTIQNGEIVPDDETTDYPDAAAHAVEYDPSTPAPEGPHPLDSPSEAHIPSQPVDFPGDGGPVSG